MALFSLRGLILEGPDFLKPSTGMAIDCACSVKQRKNSGVSFVHEELSFEDKALRGSIRPFMGALKCLVRPLRGLIRPLRRPLMAS